MTSKTKLTHIQACMAAFEKAELGQHHRLTMMHLLIENRENCSHRNNIRLWSIAEPTPGGKTLKPWLLPS